MTPVPVQRVQSLFFTLPEVNFDPDQLSLADTILRREMAVQA